MALLICARSAANFVYFVLSAQTFERKNIIIVTRSHARGFYWWSKLRSVTRYRSTWLKKLAKLGVKRAVCG